MDFYLQMTTPTVRKDSFGEEDKDQLSKDAINILLSMKNSLFKQLSKIAPNFDAQQAAGLKKKFTKPTNYLKAAAATTLVSAAIFFADKDKLATMIGKSGEETPPTLSAFTVINPTVKYGFALDTFHVMQDKIKPGDMFTDMLMKRGLTYLQAEELSKSVKSSYDFEKIQDGKPYLTLTKDPALGYDYFIYEPDNRRYFIVDLKNVTIKEIKREIKIQEFEASGKINDNLWESMVDNGFSYALTDMVEDALKYKVDLRKFQKGDEYKLIWEEEFAEGQSIGIKSLKGAYFKQKDEDSPIYAIYFDNGKGEKGWYGKDGLPLRDGFLKSPLKYSRISSHYNLKRLHPILGYVRPHFGTDYAAPHGTPILSVADGVVSEARYSGGNGNYVKVRHMKPYESQYLHMSRFAKGLKPGTRVKQGQIIGYVGSTGLATGPHVCFRFWKHGTQVNHLREKLPQVSTFSTADRAEFKKVSDSIINRLDNVPQLDEVAAAKWKKEYLTLKGKP
jgi:murein DD-endopeptidase MepM/ murein hydrolase activator NlpD